jgi:HEAT repeat protein
MSDPILLSDQEMQQFIANGYLCLKTTLPKSFHDDIYARFDAIVGNAEPVNPGNNLLPFVPELNAVFGDPAVKGALTSVLGPDYVMHPHRALHNNMPGSDAQEMHKDSYWGYTRRVRNHRPRWVMIMYVPQDTPKERGPTGVVPGSQYQIQQPDESLMPEAAGELEAGGFLLIHYDVWHRKMKNFTQDKRFMMKFEFIRMQPPAAPSWDHRGQGWALDKLPGIDMTPVWQRHWAWLGGPPGAEARLGEAERAQALAALDHAEPGRRLAGINTLARDPAAVAASLAPLALRLGDAFEPVSIDAAYAMARAGAAAVPVLAGAIRGDDGEDANVNRRSDRGETRLGQIARNAAYGLAEIGAASIPALLALLAEGQQRARKLACFALGEIEGSDAAVMAALCGAAADADAQVRINAVEALGLKPGTPASVQALTTALRDEDAQVRFSAAFSLAQLGPNARDAVPALGQALADDNRYVPGYAVEALARIATPEAMQTLIPYLKSARWCAKTTPGSIY